MVLRIFSVVVGPGQEAILEPIEDETYPLYRAAKGCRNFLYFVDPEKGEYGGVSVWDSQEDLRAFVTSGVVAPLIARVKPLLKAPPVERIYQVYEPKPVGTARTAQDSHPPAPAS